MGPPLRTDRDELIILKRNVLAGCAAGSAKVAGAGLLAASKKSSYTNYLSFLKIRMVTQSKIRKTS